jgi:hypothetical protein
MSPPGLIFLLFLLSLICSTVNETVAGVLSWRSRFLEDGLRSMLAGQSGRRESPFWFDLLGRVSRVRISGKPERKGAA